MARQLSGDEMAGGAPYWFRCKERQGSMRGVGREVRQNMERFTNLRVILAQGPC